MAPTFYCNCTSHRESQSEACLLRQAVHDIIYDTEIELTDELNELKDVCERPSIDALGLDITINVLFSVVLECGGA